MCNASVDKEILNYEICDMIKNEKENKDCVSEDEVERKIIMKFAMQKC